MSGLLPRSTFIFLLTVFGTTAVVVAKDYSFPRVVVEAVVQADGAVRMTEHRTFRFDGSFSEADYNLSRAGFDVVRDIEVSENGNPYTLNTSRKDNTYRVRERDKRVDIRWYYRARNEDRTFTISYVLEGAVVRGPEHAEFFWTYLTDGWEKPTDELEVRLRFEQPVEGAELHHFLRGASSKVETTISSDGILLAGDNLSSSDHVAMRAVFPASLVPMAPINDAEFTLAQVLHDEAEHAEKEARAAERRERRAVRWSYISLVLSLLTVVFFGMVYRRYRPNKPQLAEDFPKQTTEIPSDHPPALAAMFVSQFYVGAQSVVATLFDLCRRGYFRIVQGEEKRSFLSKETPFEIHLGDVRPSPDDLRDWEQEVVRLVVDRMSEGEREIKKIFDLNKSKNRKWYANWQKLLKADYDSYELTHPENSKAISANILAQMPLTAASIAAIAFAGPIGALPLALSIGAISFSGLVWHRTEKGERLYRGWRAYLRGLQKASPEDLEGDIDRHFVYAVVFSLSSTRTGNLVKAAPTDQFLWIIAVDGGRVSPAALSTTVTSMTASVTTNIASGTGATAGVAGAGASGGAR